MLRAIDIVGEVYFLKEIVDTLRNTVDFILKSQFPSGNIPSAFQNEVDDLVQFCYGAPGAVTLFLTAYSMFKDEKYLKAAENCGECIWHRGILVKGNCLCHGTTGNTYSFL